MAITSLPTAERVAGATEGRDVAPISHAEVNAIKKQIENALAESMQH